MRTHLQTALLGAQLGAECGAVVGAVAGALVQLSLVQSAYSADTGPLALLLPLFMLMMGLGYGLVAALFSVLPGLASALTARAYGGTRQSAFAGLAVAAVQVLVLVFASTTPWKQAEVFALVGIALVPPLVTARRVQAIDRDPSRAGSV